MKRLISLLVIIVSFSVVAQQQLPAGWDEIILDGKTAYMNSITGETSYTKPTKPAEKPKIAKEVDPTITHIVQQGETLFIIAKKYNISVDKIYGLNVKLNPKSIKEGEEIVVGYDKSKEGKIVYEVVEDLYTNRSNNNVHYVKAGETLYSISRKHGLTVAKLKELNNLTSNSLQIGQKLILK